MTRKFVTVAFASGWLAVGFAHTARAQQPMPPSPPLPRIGQPVQALPQTPFQPAGFPAPLCGPMGAGPTQFPGQPVQVLPPWQTRPGMGMNVSQFPPGIGPTFWTCWPPPPEIGPTLRWMCWPPPGERPGQPIVTPLQPGQPWLMQPLPQQGGFRPNR
jgi:hypothetical protein